MCALPKDFWKVIQEILGTYFVPDSEKSLHVSAFNLKKYSKSLEFFAVTI